MNTYLKKLKKQPITLLLFLVVYFCYGQQPTLKVNYSQKKEMSSHLKKIKDPAIKQMLMQKLGKQENYTLYSRNGVSTYQKATGYDTQQQSSVIVMGGEDVIYRDRKKAKLLRQTHLLSRKFLVSDSLKNIKWTITKDTLKIGSYRCKKAIATLQGDKKVTAWFTDQIPISEGPEIYFGLPGLILKIQTKNKQITANKISFIKESVPLDPPGKGKKITAEKFKALKKEKLQELTDQNGGNGVKIIKM